MGQDFAQAAELLESILEISNARRDNIDSRGMENLFEKNAERGRLFEEFMAENPQCLSDGSLKAVTEEIKANDKVVYINLESLLSSMLEKLTKRKKDKKAAKPRNRRR